MKSLFYSVTCMYHSERAWSGEKIPEATGVCILSPTCALRCQSVGFEHTDLTLTLFQGATLVLSLSSLFQLFVYFTFHQKTMVLHVMTFNM